MRHVDLFGQVLLDFHKGRTCKAKIERDDGHVDEENLSTHFAEYESFPNAEKKALKHTKGRVLDIGVGGRKGRSSPAELGTRGRGYRCFRRGSRSEQAERCPKTRQDVCLRSAVPQEQLRYGDRLLQQLRVVREHGGCARHARKVAWHRQERRPFPRILNPAYEDEAESASEVPQDELRQGTTSGSGHAQAAVQGPKGRMVGFIDGHARRDAPAVRKDRMEDREDLSRRYGRPCSEKALEYRQRERYKGAEPDRCEVVAKLAYLPPPLQRRPDHAVYLAPEEPAKHGDE